MYKLYYSPGACSMAVHVLLNELGVPYELEKAAISEGKTRTPEFLKLNPMGQVPVLKDGEKVLREGASILIYLMEKNKSPLLPAEGDARTNAMEWLLFCNASLHPAYSRGFFLKKLAQDTPENAKMFDAVADSINKCWTLIEERLGKTKYLAGDQITAADILMTVIANWSGGMPRPVTIGSRTKKLLAEIIARPSYQKALATEQVEYKAAA